MILPGTISYTVGGGRIVASSQSNFPVNGQQLMMQVDSLTSAMMDMNVTMEDDMEDTAKESAQNKDANLALKILTTGQQLQHQQEIRQQEQYNLQLCQYQQQ